MMMTTDYQPHPVLLVIFSFNGEELYLIFSNRVKSIRGLSTQRRPVTPNMLRNTQKVLQ